MAGNDISRAWVEIKQIRIDILGRRCENCGAEPTLLYGHHILGRDSVCVDWETCTLRCSKCELRMHELYRDGNSPESLAIQADNNAVIRRYLEVTGQ